MKHFFGFLAIALSVTMTGCNKETELAGTTPAESTAGKIEISFVSPSDAQTPDSRAFGAGTTETWEKSISKATVMVFDATGKLKLRRDLSSAEIAGASTTPVTLAVPGVAVGDNCDFAVIANRTVPASVTTKALLLAEEENDAAAYNGLFADVTTKAVRATGFAMSGMKAQAIVEATTSVAIVLERVVAKVEVVTATTAAFTAKYGPATVTANKITVSRSSLKSYLIDQSPAKYSAGGTTFTQTQAASAGKNLFYLFEKAAAAAGARTLLTIEATYDADGQSATTADQVPLIYEVELTGTTGGQIARNGSYKVNANINGLTGKDVSLTVSVANWETLVTQDVTLGN